MDYVQITMRLPKPLYEAIEEAAKAEFLKPRHIINRTLSLAYTPIKEEK